MPRRQIIDLLARRVRALQVRQRMARGGVDASLIFHWLGQRPCTLAMGGVMNYLEAARTQMARIEVATYTNRSGIFHEIHYYFICWSAIWKRLDLIKNRSGFETLKPIWRKYRFEAANYVFGRGQLEHYAEWLDGHPKYAPLAEWDHGNLIGFTYSLAGHQWDVSRASLQRLEQFVHDFTVAVMAEGTQKLMIQEMNKP